MKPFERGMGEPTRRLVSEGVRIEAAKQRGDLPPDAPGLQRVMQALGYVGGLQTQAEKQVQGNLDQSDEQAGATTAELIGLGVDFDSIFLPAGTLAGDLVWTAVLHGTGKVKDGLTQIPDEKTRLAKLQDKELQASLGLEYSMVQRLMDAHYKMKITPQEFAASRADLPHPNAEFVDGSGKLLDYGRLSQDPEALDNYISWLNANGRGGGSEDRFGQVSVNVTRTFQGTQKAASDAVTSWDKAQSK
jgi:hypothetical protein